MWAKLKRWWGAGGFDDVGLIVHAWKRVGIDLGRKAN